MKKHIPVACGNGRRKFQRRGGTFWNEPAVRTEIVPGRADGAGRKVRRGCAVLHMRGTVLAEGIGEELSVLPAMPKCTVLIAKPPISVSTKVVYEALDSSEIRKHPDIDGLLAGLEKGDLHEIAAHMGNVLEDVTIPMHPVIDEIKREMTDAGALNAMMSGSGPTVFGLFENKMEARKAQERIRTKGLAKQVYVD